MKKDFNSQRSMKKHHWQLAVILFFVSLLSAVLPILGPGFLSYFYFFEFNRIAKVFSGYKSLCLLIGGQVLPFVLSFLFVPLPFSLLVYGANICAFILGHFIYKFFFENKKRNMAAKKLKVVN